MSSSRTAHKPRTFRSGPYLNSLFVQAERMDAKLQAEICARIKQARIEAGFTQPEAADVLHITLRAYQNYEKDRVPFRSLTEIAEAFGVTEPWLLRGDYEPRTAADAATLAEVLRRLESLEGKVETAGKATTKSLDSLARDVRRLARSQGDQGAQAN